MESLRKINEIGRRAGSGEPRVEDYLRTLASDPTTEWFTELLREKNRELETERQRTDELARALRAWYCAKVIETTEHPGSGADMQLIEILRATEVLDS